MGEEVGEGGRGRKRDKTHYKISPCYQTQRSIHHRLSSRLMKGGALPSSTGTQTFLHTQAFLFRSLAYFSTCAHTGSACLVQNCRQLSSGALRAARILTKQKTKQNIKTRVQEDIRAQKALFLCTKNGTARAPRSAVS